MQTQLLKHKAQAKGPGILQVGSGVTQRFGLQYRGLRNLPDVDPAISMPVPLTGMDPCFYL